MSCKIKALALFFSFFLFISVISFISVTPVIAALHTSSMIPGVYQKYGTPRDVITLSNGDMWYADSQNHRIVKINSSGDISDLKSGYIVSFVSLILSSIFSISLL